MVTCIYSSMLKQNKASTEKGSNLYFDIMIGYTDAVLGTIVKVSYRNSKDRNLFCHVIVVLKLDHTKLTCCLITEVYPLLIPYLCNHSHFVLQRLPLKLNREINLVISG